MSKYVDLMNRRKTALLEGDPEKAEKLAQRALALIHKGQVTGADLLAGVDGTNYVELMEARKIALRAGYSDTAEQLFDQAMALVKARRVTDNEMLGGAYI